MNSVCVYCGSRIPKDPEITEVAKELGKRFAKEKWSLVYGGGNIGMMGVAADACLDAGGDVIGVIPTALKVLEVAHTGITQLHETQDMHTRKAMMESLSDAFVVLPGGFGTLDEFFEILTWRQLGFHNKPIILFNKNGYFDGLLEFVKKGLEQDFLRERALDLFKITTNIDDCMELLKDS